LQNERLFLEEKMLEDDRTQDLRKKALSEGYHVLSKEELFYLESKSINHSEQETIKRVLGLKLQEELVEETKKLAKKTWWVAFATWFLAIATALATIFGQDLKKWWLGP
jgi:hypothetical protein